MKKLLLLGLFSLVCFFQSNAQLGTCEPDLMFADSSFGVYPPPVSANNTDGGITTTACVGEPYEFVWTLKIPGEVETSDFGTVDIDSISIASEGAIQNLPAGMDYSTNITSGVFVPSVDSLACLTIFGTPQMAGTYDLLITVTIFSQNTLILIFTNNSGEYDLTLPSTLIAGAEGNYFLEVEAAGSVNCESTNTDDILASSFAVRNLPNPFSDFTNIEIVADYADQLNFRVFDLIGNQLHAELIQVNEGINNIEFDGSRLANGIYTYTIEKDGALISNRMVINR
ncbi:MAG: T9SS type A sorting domain-containing protein [Bacteroidota bacterium]